MATTALRQRAIPGTTISAGTRTWISGGRVASYGSQLACYTDGSNATSRGDGIIIAPTSLDLNAGWTKVASTGLQTTGSLPNGSNVVTLPSTTGLAVGQILLPWNGSAVSGVGIEAKIIEIIDGTRVRISGTNNGASYSGPIYVCNTATDTKIFLFHKPYNLPPKGTVRLNGGEQVTYTGIAMTGIGPRLTGCTRGANGTEAKPVRPRFSTGNAGFIAVQSPSPTPKLTKDHVFGAGAEWWEYESTWDPNRPYLRIGTGNASITELLAIKTRHAAKRFLTGSSSSTMRSRFSAFSTGMKGADVAAIRGA